MVSTGWLRLAETSKAASDKDWTTEPIVFPPREVFSTDHKSIGQALMDNMEQYFMNCSVEGMLEELCRFRHSLLLFADDQATSNRLLLKKLSALIKAVRVSLDREKNMSLWDENCGCHKASRVVIKVNKRLHVNDLYSKICSVLKSKKIRTEFAQKVSELLQKEDMFLHDDLPGPSHEGHAALVKLLNKLLCKTSLDAPVGQECLSTEELVLQLLEYIYGGGRDAFSDRPGHTCDARCRTSEHTHCPNREYVVNKLWQLMKATMLSKNPGKYNPARWRRLVPTSRWAARAVIILGEILRQALASINVPKDKEGNENVTVGKNVKYLIGKLGEPTTKFHAICALIAQDALEDIIDVLFKGSSVGTDNRDQGARKKVKALEKAEGLSAVRRLLPSPSSQRSAHPASKCGPKPRVPACV